MSLYQILAFTIHGKLLKKSCKIIKLKYQLWHPMKNLNYLMQGINQGPIFCATVVFPIAN